ncbi:hypothetical protein GOODEAATRI_007063 [Goodea atripinnis]|uniref:Uncharacterized protein n=1 Tax=Goodea atripinnis TaxID=208336 RepID=A0ABV0NI42_9TELE
MKVLSTTTTMSLLYSCTKLEQVLMSTTFIMGLVGVSSHTSYTSRDRNTCSEQLSAALVSYSQQKLPPAQIQMQLFGSIDWEIGGTTAIDVHCSGSWPTCMASVAKDLKDVRKPANKSPVSCLFDWAMAVRCSE